MSLAHTTYLIRRQQLDALIERLFMGVYSDDLIIVTDQLDRGIAVNARNETWQTPLHEAQNQAVVSLLIARVADIMVLDATGDFHI